MSVSRSLKAMGGKHGLIRAIKLHSREHYKTLVSSAMLTRQSIITMQLHSVHKYTIRLPLKNISVLLILLLCLCGMISCFGEGYVTHIAWCGILDDGLWPGCRLTLCFPVACFVYSTVDIFYHILCIYKAQDLKITVQQYTVYAYSNETWVRINNKLSWDIKKKPFKNRHLPLGPATHWKWKESNC